MHRLSFRWTKERAVRDMEPLVLQQLLASILAQRLVVVCGAGLSMGKPAAAPSAKEVSQVCFDSYTASTGAALDATLRDDLEKLADYFYDNHTLQSVFISSLVPWDRFVRPPNAGHIAIADFLWIRAVAAALSSNYDTMIERHAGNCGADVRPSLDGASATARAPVHSPLLKFHGCQFCDADSTVWTKKQLGDAVIAERIESSRAWMEANLQHKDLLVVGFWSDWSYLNTILGNVPGVVAPASVTVIDPSDSAQLQAKAPELWAVAHSAGVTFTHVQQYAETALDELHRAFSKAYLRRLLNSGKASAEAQWGAACDPTWLAPPDLSAQELYGLRRDAEGVPSTKPARLREPMSGDALGMFHLLLIRAGAVANARGYLLGGQQIRVINGANVLLSTLRQAFSDEPPAVSAADIVVGVGATDLPYPGSVVRGGTPGGMIRGTASGDWLDLSAARARLGV
jgi:hypothetical protein